MPARTFLHPTSLRPHDDAAFAHALKLASLHGASLEIVHVAGPIAPGERESFPAVQEVLDGWESDGTSPPLDWSAVQLPAQSPVTALTRDLEKNPADLVIMHTAARTGLDRLMHGSIAQALVQAGNCRLLLLPRDVHGFVSARTGRLQLQNLLIPYKNAFLGELALEVALELCAPLGPKLPRAHLLHVGNDLTGPPPSPPQHAGWLLARHQADGRVPEAILDVSAQVRADMIVMTTTGKHLVGGTLRSVLAEVGCPVLVIPAPR